MPGSVLQAKVMHATTCFPAGVPNPSLQEADVVLHDPIAFHPAHGMFDPETDGGDPTIRRLLRGREYPATRCVLRLEDRDPSQEESLETLILIQAAAGWHGIARPLCQALIRRVAFTGVAQEANVARLIDHEEVVERVARLLATVILLWLFGIFRAVHRTCGAIMPTRGGGGPSSRHVRFEPRSQLCSCAGRKQLLVCSGLIQHRMQHVNPFVRMRLTPLKQLSLSLLKRMLFHVGQHEAQRVRDRGQWAGAIGTVTATRAGLPINRAVMPGGDKGLLKIGKQGWKFGCREPGQRA
jgi:hypothetical protein